MDDRHCYTPAWIFDSTEITFFSNLFSLGDSCGLAGCDLSRQSHAIFPSSTHRFSLNRPHEADWQCRDLEDWGRTLLQSTMDFPFHFSSFSLEYFFLSIKKKKKKRNNKTPLCWQISVFLKPFSMNCYWVMLPFTFRFLRNGYREQPDQKRFSWDRSLSEMSHREKQYCVANRSILA